MIGEVWSEESNTHEARLMADWCVCVLSLKPDFYDDRKVDLF